MRDILHGMMARNAYVTNLILHTTSIILLLLIASYTATIITVKYEQEMQFPTDEVGNLIRFLYRILFSINQRKHKHAYERISIASTLLIYFINYSLRQDQCFVNVITGHCKEIAH